MKHETQLLNALKSISVAAKALRIAADQIVKLSEELKKPDLKVVENEK